VTTTLSSPDGMLAPVPYHHVSVSTGTRHVEIAGQIGHHEGGLPDDLAGQVAQALRNTARGLAGAGATFADVTRLRFFVTGWTVDQMPAFLAGVEAVADEIGMPRPMPPASLIGVEILFEPGVLVEVEASALVG
jgi:enamine deaminase RidA (YjgF/YER057c/UK114 family)